MKSALKKKQKTPKTIRDITDNNFKKNNEILTVFGIKRSDITSHPMAVQILSLPEVCCCITWENRTNAT